MVKSVDVSTMMVVTRARVVLWHTEGPLKKQAVALAVPEGITWLVDRSHAASREQVPTQVRTRILAATRTSPPADTGLLHWSSREMAAFNKRTEGVYVSRHYMAKLWRENGLRPHQRGTFKDGREDADPGV